MTTTKTISRRSCEVSLTGLDCPVILQHGLPYYNVLLYVLIALLPTLLWAGRLCKSLICNIKEGREVKVGEKSRPSSLLAGVDEGVHRRRVQRHRRGRGVVTGNEDA